MIDSEIDRSWVVLGELLNLLMESFNGLDAHTLLPTVVAHVDSGIPDVDVVPRREGDVIVHVSDMDFFSAIYAFSHCLDFHPGPGFFHLFGSSPTLRRYVRLYRPLYFMCSITFSPCLIIEGMTLVMSL